MVASGEYGDAEHQRLVREWVVAYTDALYARASRRVSDAMLAEDLVQEVFLAAWQHRERLRDAAAARSWLFAMLENKIRDHYRRLFREGATVSGSEFFDENGAWKLEARPQMWETEGHALDDPDFRAALQLCLQALSPTAYAAVQGCYLDEKSGSELCQELGLQASAYWQLLHRARLNLRRCMERSWFLKGES